MSKLFKLKNWLTIEDTAKHLTSIFDEPIKDYDVLRFALDGHLKFSLNLMNHATARKCRVVSYENVRKVPSLDGDCLVALGIYIGDGNFLEREKEIITIEGIMDLMMIGNDRLEIEHEYQQLTSGIELTLVCLEGVFIRSIEDGNIYELQDRFDYNVNKGRKDVNNYYPAGRLPADAAIVVRTSAISEFIEAAGTDQEIENKPIADTDRTHVSDYLATLNQAATKFWANADHNDDTTHPINSTVAAWLMDRGYTKTLAEKGATIIRPEWASKGRKADK